MQTKRAYSLKETFAWSQKYLYYAAAISMVYVCLYDLVGWKFIRLPWLPISLVGVAVAFFLGFKNNSSYDRLWEARKIWGAIVNASRSWAAMSKDFVTNESAHAPLSDVELHDEHRQLIHRHVAWLTALRHQLRQPRSWEHNDRRNNRARKMYNVVEFMVPLRDELKPLLPDKEWNFVLERKNTATHIVSMQSEHLRRLKEAGHLDSFRQVAMQDLLTEFYTLQGKSERIKNFPFPRQYATFNLFAVWLFVLLMPLGMLTAFEEMVDHSHILPHFVWLTVPFSAIVGWVFMTMDQVGDYSENPFEGLWNDIPITALSRTIEIDLREMLGETDLPDSIGPVNHILS